MQEGLLVDPISPVGVNLDLRRTYRACEYLCLYAADWPLIAGGPRDFQISIYFIFLCLGWFLIKNEPVWWSQNICDVFRSQDINGFLYPCVHIGAHAHGKYRWVFK